jgi:transposase
LEEVVGTMVKACPIGKLPNRFSLGTARCWLFALALSISSLASAASDWPVFEGAWFTVAYPPSFTAQIRSEIKGSTPSELEGWRSAAVAALAAPEEACASPQQTRQDKRRIQELEREVKRKEKAVAETAALLVLSKKLSAVFGEGAGA